MRLQTALPALLLPLALVASGPAPAQKLPSVTISTSPSEPAPEDAITLKLSGQWPDGCVPEASRTILSIDGSRIRVVFNYSGFSGACTAAVTPWRLDVPLGRLAAGTYAVEVDVLRGLMPPDVIGTGSFRVAPLAEGTLWFPGFFAPGPAVTMASTLTAYNNTDHEATVTYLGAWDGFGAYTAPAPAEVGPHSAVVLDSRSLREGQPVQMLAVKAPRRVAFRATLERLETVPEALPKVPESYGRLELPVFTELFPAGMTAVAGDVSLSSVECASGPEARRRVNLTLFNAGDAWARFRVSAVSAGPVAGGAGDVREFEVPPHALAQFNAIPLEGLPVCEAGGAWFRITGDQPFLAYLSSVRPETRSEILPYEIFPARLDR